MAETNGLSRETLAIIGVIREHRQRGETSLTTDCALEILRVLDNLPKAS